MLLFSEFLNELKISELSDLADKKRKKRSSRLEVEYVGLKEKRGGITFAFSTFDPEGYSQTPKQVLLQFQGAKNYSKISKILDSENNFLNALENKNVKIHCGCKDFKFQGYKFMGSKDQMNYGIYKEDRPPEIKNPELKGSLCKHCLAVVENMDKYYDMIIEKMFNKK